MNNTFFAEFARDPNTRARTGRLHFPNGTEVDTPLFMPVGTQGSVKALWQEDLESIGYSLILANTYHLHLRPGDELIERLGGTKKFISWNGLILTDSGGFQAFSLAERVKLRDDGIEFASHIDGSRHLFSPESTIDIQRRLGSDIMMVIDDCPPGDADEARLRDSLERTHRWAAASTAYRSKLLDEGDEKAKTQKLFGIIQGGTNAEFRRESAERLQELPFDGIATGGLSVGESRESFYETMAGLGPHLDPERPRYLMGVGVISDLLEAVMHGYDMFDCVLPTRNARNGQVFTRIGKLNMRNAIHTEDAGPIDESCTCRVCKRYSRAYIRHLFLSHEMLGAQLATYHNLYFLHNFMAEMRTAIRAGQFLKFYTEWKSHHGQSL